MLKQKGCTKIKYKLECGSDSATVTTIVNGFVCLAGLCLVLGVCQAHPLCERAQ